MSNWFHRTVGRCKCGGAYTIPSTWKGRKPLPMCDRCFRVWASYWEEMAKKPG